MGHEELRDMRHDHFVNSTCDIGDPPSRAPCIMRLGGLFEQQTRVRFATKEGEGVGF